MTKMKEEKVDLTCYITGFKYKILNTNEERGTTKIAYIGRGAGPKGNNKTTVYTRNIRNGIIYPDEG